MSEPTSAAEQDEMVDAPRCPDCGWNNGEHSSACGVAKSSRLYNQQAVAEALDDLVSSRGVTLDDDRLDWLTEWVIAREAAALQCAVALLRRFPPTDGQRAGMSAAIVLVESLVPSLPSAKTCSQPFSNGDSCDLPEGHDA
jgi:hypothetical protein